MSNQSKVNDPRFWKKWRESGAVGNIETARARGTVCVRKRFVVPISEPVITINSEPAAITEEFGWEALEPGTTRVVLSRPNSEGKIGKTLLVWWSIQRSSAKYYGDAHFAADGYQVVVCHNPNDELEKRGIDNALIYHHG